MTGLGRVGMRGIVKTHGAVTALRSLDLDVEPGEFFALLGPSGSGKTTTLRILAGLEKADRGQVLVDGEDVTRHEPGDRDVAMVFQSYALYPHMTVRQNISFPLRMVGTAKREMDQAVADAAARVRIDELLERKPGQLSGGQQQRVALARAIVRKPKLFLLDEPLSNLDAKLRVETRVELMKLQRSLDVTTVYVTHDQEEAMTMADRMAVFFEGELAQIGSPEDVFDRPANMRVASFLGNPAMNLIPGELSGRTISIEGQTLELPVAESGTGQPRTVVLGVRPGDVRIGVDGFPASVYLTEILGDSSIVNIRFGSSLIKARLGEKRRLAEGEPIGITFAHENLILFDQTSGQRLDLS